MHDDGTVFIDKVNQAAVARFWGKRSGIDYPRPRAGAGRLVENEGLFNGALFDDVFEIGRGSHIIVGQGVIRVALRRLRNLRRAVSHSF